MSTSVRRGAHPAGWVVRAAVVVAVAGLAVVVLVRRPGGPEPRSDGPGIVQTGAGATGEPTDGGHGETHAPVPLDPAVQKVLDAQVAGVHAAIDRYRTVADALADGYVFAGGDTGRNDTHLVRWGRMDATVDLEAPEMLLAETDAPTSPIVAVVYMDITRDSSPPEGFAGGNDHWHEHRKVCVADGRGLGEGGDISEAACAAKGGTFGPMDGWMLHAWVVPEHENPEGLFAPENPRAPLS